MKKITCIIAALAVSANCQTVRIQGVEITQKQQLWVSAALIAGATLVAMQADSDETAEDPKKCLKFLPVSGLKSPGQPSACLEYAN